MRAKISQQSQPVAAPETTKGTSTTTTKTKKKPERTMSVKGVNISTETISNPSKSMGAPVTEPVEATITTIKIPLSQLMNNADVRNAVIDSMADRLTDEMMEHFEKLMNGEEDDFEFAGQDKDLCTAIMTRIREKQLQLMFAERFELEGKLIKINQAQIEDLKESIKKLLARINKLAEEIRATVSRHSELAGRIDRCRENYEWHLPQKIAKLADKARQYKNSMMDYSGKRREAMEKKHEEMLAEIAAKEKEREGVKVKIERLTAESEALVKATDALRLEVPTLEAEKDKLYEQIRVLEVENREYKKPLFIFWPFEEGVVLTTHNVKYDLVDDNLRPMTEREIFQSIEWADKLKRHCDSNGIELTNYDVAALVRFFVLASKESECEILLGDGAEYLRPIMDALLP